MIFMSSVPEEGEMILLDIIFAMQIIARVTLIARVARVSDLASKLATPNGKTDK